MKNISFGFYSSLAAIQQRPFHIQEVVLLESRQDKRIQEVKDLVLENNIKYRLVSKDELDKICDNSNHQGVMIVYKEQQAHSEIGLLEYCASSTEPLLLLILDQIVDPHNLGACLRTAEAAGANAVISSTRNSAPLTPTVRKVACGAAERIPLIFAKNLARFMEELKQLGVWVYGTRPDAPKLIYQVDFTRSVALVVGAEGAGMRRLVSEKCDELLRLPMSGEMASLNASVASGIGLFEAVRQRQMG
ncbi:MAG: 23S rRNA (guanosine(2251)-2'-O)-methyltransferase RlmB [Gammaproteobacteria bacterium]